MAIWLRVTVAMLAIVAQTAVAAGWGGGRPGAQAQTQRPPPNQFQRDPQRDFGRQQTAPQRDQRADGRMSEEERRNLHRDLDRANREIYKGRR